ncbi:hypothetical protein F2Q68_00006397 [Brassica cretica]|uniref:Uncharacterized protein n=1 Tax=Brassica cretica TaxID=69181 RepID=A0A8S9JFK0_BRACR|nr:hypothetical protein F2Q68_00006397 [Brassica cretica]
MRKAAYTGLGGIPLKLEKGKGIADSPSPIRDVSATDSPLDDFDLILRDALRDTENMTLSQRLLVADAHRMIRDEGADRVEVGSSDVSGSGSDASSQTSRHSRRARRGIPFDQIDCRPTIYHPGGIFEELSPLPPELLRDPRAQSWGNVFDSCSSHKTAAYTSSGGIPLKLGTFGRLGRPSKSTLSSLVSGAAVSVNLWVRFIRIAGSDAREKGKGIADSPSSTRDASSTDSPLDDFNLIHRDALRDTENMTLSQRLLVADAHRMIRDEGADRAGVGSSDVSGSGSDASSQTSRHSRRARRWIPFDQVDCRPTIYHPGGIFEELSPLSPELLRDPRAHHLLWPDLSREWIRRQEARIARGEFVGLSLRSFHQQLISAVPMFLLTI